MPYVRSRYLLRVSKSQHSRTRSSIYFSFFPPFLFFSFFASFFPTSWRFNCSGASFSIKPPSFPSHFLVSLSCSSLCFRFLMVDYSMVRSNCSSISFFFACLTSLLEVVGRQRPKVRFFVGRDCSFRFALHFLFPLVHRSVWFAQPLVMSREGDVRSNELKAGLFSSEDRKALKVTSPSTPYKA